MKRFFHSELIDIRSHILLMAEKAVESTKLAIHALLETDPDLAQQVRDKDDAIDNLEVMIDSEVIRYISLRAPVASELRLLAVGMKVGHDLERVGDEATSIAKRTQSLCDTFPVKDFKHIPKMADIALSMLRDAIDTLLNEHPPQRAIEICARDKEVDTLNRQNFEHWTTEIAKAPEITPTALELMFISKSIERIADHATNMAEEIVYLHSGEDMRHSEELKKLKRG